MFDLLVANADAGGDQTIGLWITIATVAVFVAFGIYFAIVGRRLRWPEGDRIRYENKDGIVAHFIFSDGAGKSAPARVTRKRYARKATYAARAIYEAWRNVMSDDEDVQRDLDRMWGGGLRKFAVLVMDDEEFDKYDGKDQFLDSVNGTVGRVSRMFGNGIPLVMFRAKFLPRLDAHGGILIHELLHVANRARGSEGNIWTAVRHENDRIWGATCKAAAGDKCGEDTVESRARGLYSGPFSQGK